MAILIEIGHPAHVHFFSRAIDRMKRAGRDVYVVSRNKEITNQLLEKHGIDYRCLSTPATSSLGKVFELLFRWIKIGQLIFSKKIRLAVSISGISTSLPAKLLGIRNIMFTDTEDARLSNKIAVPFCDGIFTPNYFRGSLGKRHHSYNGIHELAYLQNYPQKTNENQLTRLPSQFCVVRLVANDAFHDIGLRGIGDDQLEALFQSVAFFGEPIVTSQERLPERWKKYQASIPIEQVHSVLQRACLFVGDSPTMAVESSLLGTPAVLVSPRSRHLGNMLDLEREGLLHNFDSWESARAWLEKIKDVKKLKDQWGKRAANYRNAKPDMSEFVFRTIEKEFEQCAG